LCPALVVALLQYFVTIRRYGKPAGSLAAAAFTFGITFVLCLLALIIASHLTKKRQQALNREPED
ncbi:MAG: hypothetical protein IJV64_07390, partial [Oscillospiraceae bacterium]|nr:hypothetical protein [Oscillospiraceae bacterium]